MESPSVRSKKLGGAEGEPNGGRLMHLSPLAMAETSLSMGRLEMEVLSPLCGVERVPVSQLRGHLGYPQSRDK